MKAGRLSRIVLVLLGIVALLVGCAPEAVLPPEEADRSEPAEAAAARPAASPAAAAAPPPGAAPLRAAQRAEAEPPSLLERMIIRTAEVKVAVPDVRRAMEEVERIATLVGGVVFASSFNAAQREQQATVTLKVPPDEKTFQEVMDRIAAIEGAKVTDRNIRSQDVTEEFTDVEAQLRNLRSTEARLLALLEKASRLEDILALERELSNLRNRIERLEGRKRLLERRVEQATIVVSLRQVVPAKDGEAAEWNALRIVASAFAALVEATRGLVTVLIWLAVWSPLYGPVLVLLWLARRRLRLARPAG